MNEPTRNIRPLSSLEISGAICGRVMHDLSNLISGILGNAEYAQNPDADPATRQKALEAISLSANNAGKLLGQCLPLGQLVSRDAFPYEAAEQAAGYCRGRVSRVGLARDRPGQLAGQTQRAIHVAHGDGVADCAGDGILWRRGGICVRPGDFPGGVVRGQPEY